MHLSENNFPPFNVNILVVDGDAIALNTTVETLTSLNYQVVGTTKSSIALDKLRKHPRYFQLIITEVHASDFDGFNLKQIVDEEFSIPVIMISVENNEEIQRKATMSGVMRYILKPAKLDDFIDIWQFAIVVMNDEMPSNIKLVGDIIEESSGERNHKICSSFKQKEVRVEQKGDDMKQSLTSTEKDNGSTTLKKTKVIWTKDLHSQFLKAIDIIGFESASPARILKIMNVQGLTRENVGSHLQKYRLYLKDVERILVLIVKKANEDNDVFLSNMVTTHRSLVFNLIKDDLEKNLKHSNMSLHYLKSNDIYISHLRSKLSYLLRLNNIKHLYHSKMIPHVKMGLLIDKNINNLDVTNNTSKLYDQYLNDTTYQLRSDSNSVQNVYNNLYQNHPINPFGSISYNFNKHGLGQTSSSNVTNCNVVASFQGLVRSSQMQPKGMLKLNSSHLFEGIMSTVSEVCSINQILPISMKDTNNAENIVIGENLFQPQQQHKIYDQGNNQTFASLGNNFDSQVTSSGSNFKGSDDAFSKEDILNKVSMQDKNKGDGSRKEIDPSHCVMHINTSKAKASTHCEEATSTNIPIYLKQYDNYVPSFDQFPHQCEEATSTNIPIYLNHCDNYVPSFDQFPHQLEWDDNFIEFILNDMA